MDVGDAAPDAVGPITQFGFEAEGFANGGVNAIAGDDEIRFGGSSIFELKKDGVGTLLEARESVVQVDGAGRNGFGEGGLQFGAMDGEAAAIVGGQGKSFDSFAIRVFHEQVAERAALGGEAGENVGADLIERADGVGPEAHAGADFF